MDKKKLLRTMVPLIIFVVVIGIWFFKNLSEEAELDLQADLAFPLHVSAVNMEELKAHNLPVIIDFGADSCVPCKEMAPVLRLLNAEMQEKAIIQFVDVWKHPGSADGFPVQVIPTQLFYTAQGKPYEPSEHMAIPFRIYKHKETQEHMFTVHQGGLTEAQMRAILHDMGVR